MAQAHRVGGKRAKGWKGRQLRAACLATPKRGQALLVFWPGADAVMRLKLNECHMSALSLVTIVTMSMLEPASGEEGGPV